MKSRNTLNRLQEVMRRQHAVRFGPAYEPAIQATREEAPSLSKPTSFYSQRLQRRIHALSAIEADWFTFALYNPAVFELHEQHILSPSATAHPLSSHPSARKLDLPFSSGTVVLADRLGVLDRHPVIYEDLDPQHEALDGDSSDPDGGSTNDSQGPAAPVPFPWIGDALLYLRDAQGPYCLSWDVKRKEGDHGRPGPDPWHQRTNVRRVRNATAREQVYCAYMDELAIRIVRVSDQLPEALTVSLRKLRRYHHRSVNQPVNAVAELLFQLVEQVPKGVVPLDIFLRAQKSGWTLEEFRCVLYQAIWERKLLVDLGSSLDIDSPLQPEESDPFIEHASFFHR